MSTQHTPGPWQHVTTNSTAPDIRAVSGRAVARTWGACRSNPKTAEGSQRRAEEDLANGRLIAAAPDLSALAHNFEITGPDADGLVWLVLRGNGTTGRAMFNLGSADKLAPQVALHLEADRRAAIAKSTGSAT
jgi:hypothetical protein